MPLSDTKIRSLGAGRKPRQVSDGSGLHLEISPKGKRVWRYRYRLLGKQEKVTLGERDDTPRSAFRAGRRRVASQNPDVAAACTSVREPASDAGRGGPIRSPTQEDRGLLGQCLRSTP